MQSENKCLKAIVTGTVQGVGFRAATRREALARKVKGSAMNLPDGSVEVIMFGADKSVDNLCQWLKIGPKSATVESVALEELPLKPVTGFITGSKS